MSASSLPSTPAPSETHCSLDSCRRLSFLPLTCSHCTQSFCSSHCATPSQHKCNPPTDQRYRKPGEKKRFEEGRRFEELLPPTSEERRRVEQDSLAVQSVIQASKKEAIVNLLRENFPSSSTSSSSSAQPSVAKKLKLKPVSPVIKLMKLKQRAVPLESRKGKEVEMKDRWYFTARFFEDTDLPIDGPSEEDAKAVWCEKVC